ncbi:MAG TPA: flagellar assembly protein FliH [Burkholderiales bacterium]|nr:flagellar assembly protein FliH [Burkholderiales bacterium]
MANNFIPKEQLSAYQRWELNSFDSAANARNAQADADKVKHINRQAYKEGYAAGYQEGRNRAHAEAMRVAALAQGIERALSSIDQQVAENLLACALAVAKQLVRQGLRVHPEIVLAVVREALAFVPPFTQQARLVLHPEDAQMVRAHLGEHLAATACAIVEDPSIERGGCRVETSGCEVDATLATRWQQIVATLGQRDDWLR